MTMRQFHAMIDAHILRALARTSRHLHPTIASFETLIRLKAEKR